MKTKLRCFEDKAAVLPKSKLANGKIADQVGNDKLTEIQNEDKVDIGKVKCSLYLPCAEPTKC